MKYEKGMMVRIKENLNETYKHFGHNKTMDTMKGKVFKIINVEDNGDRISIAIEPYSANFKFRPGDLEDPLIKKPEPKLKSMLFDISLLDL